MEGKDTFVFALRSRKISTEFPCHTHTEYIVYPHITSTWMQTCKFKVEGQRTRNIIVGLCNAIWEAATCSKFDGIKRVVERPLKGLCVRGLWVEFNFNCIWCQLSLPHALATTAEILARNDASRKIKREYEWKLLTVNALKPTATHIHTLYSPVVAISSGCWFSCWWCCHISPTTLLPSLYLYRPLYR